MAFKVKKSSKGYSSNEAALNLISYRARSEKEVRLKLIEREFGLEDIDKTIIWLKDYGYLNDEKFASDLASSRIRVKHWGPLKISQELALKGLSREVISTVLDDYDDVLQKETATQALDKWVRKHNVTPPLDDKNSQKAIRHLQSRGFTGQSVFFCNKEI